MATQQATSLEPRSLHPADCRARRAAASAVFRAPEQLAALVGSLQQAVCVLAQQRELLLEHRRQAAHGDGGLAARRRVPWLLLAAAGYGQALLSRADVAALFLSRKILLTELTPVGCVARRAA